MRTPGESLHHRPAALWRAILSVGPRARRACDRVVEEGQFRMEDLAAEIASLSGRDLGSALAGADQAGTVPRA